VLLSGLKDAVINSIDDPNRQGKNSFVPAMLKAYDEINKFKGGGLPQFAGGAMTRDDDKSQYFAGQGLDPNAGPTGPTMASYGTAPRASNQKSGSWGSTIKRGANAVTGGILGGDGGGFMGNLKTRAAALSGGTVDADSVAPDPTVPTATGATGSNNFNARNIAQNISSAYGEMAGARGQLGRFNRAGQTNDRFDRGVQGAFADRALQEAASQRADYGADLQTQDASDRGWANLGLGAERARGPSVWQNMSNLGTSFLANRNA
jgi:hypothetical protein